MKWPSWLKLRHRREPPTQASRTACPRCGEEMVFVEKFTMTGDDIRIYRCNHCQQEHGIDFGVALWKVLSDANRKP